MTRAHPYRNLYLIILAATITVAAIAGALFVWLFSSLPQAANAASPSVRPTSQILDRNGKLLYEVIDPNAGKQIDLDLEAIPPACVQATLATEDSRFYFHPGFDPLAILRAAWQNWRAGGAIVSGGSTLTQQLVRILLFDESERYEQTFHRKIREAWLAWRLEQIFTKDELLALYLNQSYYGNFAFGLEAAAQTFFAKPAEQLSQAECALLAGLVQYPSGYNPLINPDTAKERQLTVLRLMAEAGYLTADERQQIAAEPLRFRSSLFRISAPHFVMYVLDQLSRDLGPDILRRGGLTVYTTLDLDLQRQSEQRLRHRLDLLNCRTPGLCTATTDPGRRADNAAAVILSNAPHSGTAGRGEILTLIGSPDYFDAAIQGNVNAALALRQPGSAIKPFTYAAALDPQWSDAAGVEPLTPASIIADLPATFYVTDENGGQAPYQPVNYDRRYHGPVSVRSALANSYNIPAVKTLHRIGVETLRSLAMAAGVRSLTSDYGLALTLGGGEVSLLDLTSAFGIFLDGTRLTPRSILDVQVRGDDGERRSLPPYSERINPGITDSVIEPETAYLISHILSDDIARIPAFGEGSVLKLPFEAAVKTGTTTDWRDNWTVGYTTERLVGVWVGNADNSPMLDVSGIDGAGPIWHDLMLEAHGHGLRSPAPFARPEAIVETEICAPSGFLPTDACPSVRREIFIRGTEPQQADNQFQIIPLDRRSGLRADENTPLEYRTDRVFWMLPPAYAEWVIGQGIPIAPRPQATPREAVWSPQDPSDRADAGDRDPINANNSASSSGPLHLEGPISQTAYQIHPGVPASSQRIRLSGYAGDGVIWTTLRLVKDGVTLVEVAGASQIAAWWPLETGDHRFWIEGVREPNGPKAVSNAAFVQVRSFAAESEPVAQAP